MHISNYHIHSNIHNIFVNHNKSGGGMTGEPCRDEPDDYETANSNET